MTSGDAVCSCACVMQAAHLCQTYILSCLHPTCGIFIPSVSAQRELLQKLPLEVQSPPHLGPGQAWALCLAWGLTARAGPPVAARLRPRPPHEVLGQNCSQSCINARLLFRDSCAGLRRPQDPASLYGQGTLQLHNIATRRMSVMDCSTVQLNGGQI